MIVFFYIFLGFSLINFSFYAYFARFSWSKDRYPSKKANFAVSIIICAKNEAENLLIAIPKILDQTYTNFELVLINHSSTDTTCKVIQNFASEDSRITLVNFKNSGEDLTAKKHALSQGIEKAKHKHLLFIDADCAPTSKQWVQEMANGFERDNDNTQIVLGFSSYKKIHGSWLNKIIRYETVLTALTYFGFAENKNAYMGVGRNLAYTKKLYHHHRGFESHINIASGDDDLFVNKAATRINTTCIYGINSFTLSTPKKSWGEWLQQKRRHTSTASHYKMKHKSALALFYLSELVFLPLAVGLFIFQRDILIFTLLIFALRMIFVWSVVASAMKRLNEKGLIAWFPLLEFFLVLMQFIIFISSFVYRSEPWKKNLT